MPTINNVALIAKGLCCYQAYANDNNTEGVPATHPCVFSSYCVGSECTKCLLHDVDAVTEEQLISFIKKHNIEIIIND